MHITVVGAVYVGLSNALLLAVQHDVTLLEIDAAKVDKVARGVSPIVDADVEAALSGQSLHL